MKKRFAIYGWLHTVLLFIVCVSANAAEVSRALPGKLTPMEQPGVATQNTIPDESIQTISPPTLSNQSNQAVVLSRGAVSLRTAAAPQPTRSAVSSRTAAVANARDSLNETARQVGRNARVESAGINASAPMRRAGLVVRPTVAEVGGRAKIVGTDIPTGSNVGKVRAVAARAATDGISAVGIDESAAATESCLAQYTDCMDQFCSVIDANQKRCSCSNRLSSYSRVESAVKDANAQLNDVAQRIRYVGLSADEIRAIMNATEAEVALQTTRDNTQSRDMLEQIEDLIRQPESFVSETGGTILDMDFTFDPNADPLDIFNLEGNSTTSFSNLRGTELYNAAKQRCQNVLTSCTARGANVGQVQGRYDMEIDKDCINYESGLNKMNDTLRSNVRSATQMLQKARLSVLQNQNQYDAKGCIGALEQCMKDDMVCGGDYSKCLDPTKRYIDESGNVILGQNIATIRNMMTGYDNSLIDAGFVSGAWGMSGYPNCDMAPNNNGKCVVKYLLSKIGMGEAATSGLCRPVLDKCRRMTYDARGKYDNKNSIVVGYVQRAMTNISAAQEKIISDYASSCMAEIATCYSKQVTQINAWSSNANINNVYSVLKGACRNVALTCSYAVFSADQSAAGCPPDDTNTCIENISDIFYQSMLCPDYSFWVPNESAIAQLGTIYNGTNIYVNERCVCQAGYGVNLGRCEQCPTGTNFDTSCTAASGACAMMGCKCPTGQTWSGSACITPTPL